jgi:hypothetical protein
MCFYNHVLVNWVHACMFYRLLGAHRDARQGWGCLQIHSDGEAPWRHGTTPGMTSAARSERMESMMEAVERSWKRRCRPPRSLRHWMGFLRVNGEEVEVKLVAWWLAPA